MSQLEAWIRNVIMIILFGTMLELAIPGTVMRKYLRLVLGLLVMLALLSPIVGLIKGGPPKFPLANGPDFAQGSVATGSSLWQANLSQIYANAALAVARQNGFAPTGANSGVHSGVISYIRVTLPGSVSGADLSRLRTAEASYFALDPGQIQIQF